MHLPPTEYLDAHDLAIILKVSPATILRRARTKPQTLPPPVHLGPNFPLRWRQRDVCYWLAQMGFYEADTRFPGLSPVVH
ncbi:conserved hypothetical protein [Cupriavidus taiwanensis]|uniref:Uncharacterized protein n=1 Tax=Cupriavidus taiwanensis TaxID=164546 RepID=A0A976B2I8_9BURK|nr:conserved hypothetical protein [Cupriavidus taiwanensis]SOZ69677.1 conserved hypothetical protein [Cupriavidus taiwanensis]SOZ72888.1 conserved hypothetical protein [Cupriavidus taiwanensis]SPA09746.1 conserved hypothetical protein [Cupriavidus taiwanensis]SPA22010.1 conserved hypothetical protein [Cupriavidus taiwanensis]